MRKELLIKWFCVALICAILFSAIGYAYGSMIATSKCNAYWMNKTENIKCTGLDILQDSQTVSTDDVIFDLDKVDLTKLNFTSIEVNN